MFFFFFKSPVADLEGSEGLLESPFTGSYHYGNLGFVTYSGVIVRLPSNKADKNENFRICLLRDYIV